MKYFIILVFGLIFGSFINALVWRIYIKTKTVNKDKAKFSILKGRSMCPNCHHQLAVLDLIPVFSWIGLEGKCRYCKKHIGFQYPLIEILTSLLFLFSYMYWPFKYNFLGYCLFILWLIILVYFISLALYDLKYKLLPNSLVYAVNILAFVFILIEFIF